MKMSQAKYNIRLSEDELKQAIEYYTLHKYKQNIKIEHITHKTKRWTEGGAGMPEIDYCIDDGVDCVCHEVM